MTSALKYIPALILIFTLIGCQDESPPKEAPQQDQPQQQLPNQMQQPSADIDVSEDELSIFTNAVVAAQKVQMKAQQKMVEAIKDEGMDVETYSQIAQATQRGQSTDQLDVSDENLQKFKSVSDDLMDIQKQAGEKMSEVIEEEGMQMDRFQKINMAVQQDRELQQRIQQKMQETQMPQSQDSQPDGN